MLERRRVRIVLAVALALAPAPGASGQLAVWDQARVTAQARDLVAATEALQEIFARQQQPDPGSTQIRFYQPLEHRVRVMRVEARVLVQSLEEGEGREQTMWIYDNLMSHARSARYEARGAFLTDDVGQRAAAVRAALNRLGPFYDPDFQTLAPEPRLEPGSTR